MLRTRPRDRESARRHQERVGRRRRSRDSSSGAEPVEGQEVVEEESLSISAWRCCIIPDKAKGISKLPFLGPKSQSQ